MSRERWVVKFQKDGETELVKWLLKGAVRGQVDDGEKKVRTGFAGPHHFD